MDLILKIRQYKKRARMNSEELADKIGISACYLSLIMHGHRQPGKKFLEGLMQIQELKPSVIKYMGRRK
jgi:transcriptional regulator with XRE-family HTH domain